METKQSKTPAPAAGKNPAADIPSARTVPELRAQVVAWRKAGLTIGFVPTMGALHEGHLSLVALAKQRCDKVVVSIFVNPKQFAPTEDFDTYPRDEAGDGAKVTGAGCDLIFAPTPAIMYPPGFVTKVEVTGISEGLCGAVRPHFFGGVATVVSKLLLQCLPDVAIFGEKDYQQLQVIKALTRDLDIPVEILGGPTVREPDGLAMSSRNAYLTADERKAAPLLHRTMADVAATVINGGLVADALTKGRATIQAAGFKLDYLELRDAETLRPVTGIPTRPTRVLVAAWLGKTRLIDNLGV